MGVRKKISILLPAYNEASHIENTITETDRAFSQLGYDFEIVVIDDGSIDRTVDEIRRISQNMPHVSVKRNLANYGKGRALKKGVRYCKGDYIIFLDADMDLHPAQIKTFFDIMELDRADVVIGSKRHPNSVLSYPLHRRLVSTVYFFVVKVLFGLPIRDTQTGLKLFKAGVLKQAMPKLLVKKFAYDLELLVNIHRLGYKIAEAPVVIDSQRTFGRIGARSIMRTLWDTLAVWYRMYVLHYYESANGR